MARNDCPCLCHNNTHADFNFSCGQCYAANHMAHLNNKPKKQAKPTPRAKKEKPAAKAAVAPEKA